MESDLKKVFYVLVAIGMIGVVSVCIVKPIATKVKAQQTPIENVSFTEGVTP